MRPQALRLREALGRRGVREQARGRVADHRGLLDEVVDGQRAGEGRGAARGQRVVGAGHVVAQRLAAPGAHEDGPRVADGAEQPHRVGAVQLEVLGRDRVDGLEGGGHVGSDHDRPLLGEGRGGDVAAGVGGEQRLGRPLHALGEGGVAGDEVACGERVVLRLGHEVRGDHGGLGRGVREHAHLRGAGDHVDADIARDQALGSGDVGVAGPGHLLHPRDRLGAVRERRYGLRPADGVDLVHAAHLGRGERVGGDGAGPRRGVALRRRDHDHAAHPGDLGGDGVHEDGRGVLRAAARHVDARRRHRRHLHAEHGAVGARGEPALPDLAFVEVADLRGGLLERGQEGGVEPLERRVDLHVGQAEVRHVHAVELAAEAAQGLVPAGAHLVDDPLGRSRDVRRHGALAREHARLQALARRERDGPHPHSYRGTGCARRLRAAHPRP